MFPFGQFPGVWVLIADVSVPSQFHLHRQVHPPAYEDGTDRGFRNVGYQSSDAGELPKRKHVTYRTRRKLKIKNFVIVLFLFRVFYLK